MMIIIKSHQYQANIRVSAAVISRRDSQKPVCFLKSNSQSAYFDRKEIRTCFVRNITSRQKNQPLSAL